MTVAELTDKPKLKHLQVVNPSSPLQYKLANVSVHLFSNGLTSLDAHDQKAINFYHLSNCDLSGWSGKVQLLQEDLTFEQVNFPHILNAFSLPRCHTLRFTQGLPVAIDFSKCAKLSVLKVRLDHLDPKIDEVIRRIPCLRCLHLNVNSLSIQTLERWLVKSPFKVSHLVRLSTDTLVADHDISYPLTINDRLTAHYRITEKKCAKEKKGSVLCYYLHPKANEDLNPKILNTEQE